MAWRGSSGFLVLILVSSSTMMVPLRSVSHVYTSLAASNVRYASISDFFDNMSTVECVVLCDRNDSCASVNYNLVTRRCELSPWLPRIRYPSLTDETNWKVFYNDRKIPAISAWQASDYILYDKPLWATYAIDGNQRNFCGHYGCPCAKNKLGLSFWAMEFDNIATVDYLVIIFINSDFLNDRNQKLQILVSMTKDDSDNNIGTQCAYYPGPPVTPAFPIKIKCTEQVTGKFLKIIQHEFTYLTLCEVEAYFI